MVSPNVAPMKAIARSLRHYRERADLSQAEVARRAGIAKSTLSQLESGTGNPSVETLWALSVALDTPFADLVDAPRPTVRIIRAGEGPEVPSERANYRATVVSASPPHTRRDIYRVTAEPGVPRESEPHMPGVIEHVIVSTGRALVGPAGAPAELGPGDYICYPGDEPHVFDALEPGTSAVLVSEHH